MNKQLPLFHPPSAYWITVTNHKVIPAGTRYLVVAGRDYGVLAWENGVKPVGDVLGVVLMFGAFEVER